MDIAETAEVIPFQYYKMSISFFAAQYDHIDKKGVEKKEDNQEIKWEVKHGLRLCHGIIPEV